MWGTGSGTMQGWSFNLRIPQSIYKYWKMSFSFRGKLLTNVEIWHPSFSIWSKASHSENIQNRYPLQICYPTSPFRANPVHLESSKFSNTTGFELTTSSDCNETQIHNHIVRKRTLNPLAKLGSYSWLNGWVSIYQIGGCGFESCCSH